MTKFLVTGVFYSSVVAVSFITYLTAYICWDIKENLCPRKQIPSLLVVVTTPLMRNLQAHRHGSSSLWGLKICQKCSTIAALYFLKLSIVSPHSRYQSLGAVDEKPYHRVDHKVLPLKNWNFRSGCLISYRNQQLFAWLLFCFDYIYLYLKPREYTPVSYFLLLDLNQLSWKLAYRMQKTNVYINNYKSKMKATQRIKQFSKSFSKPDGSALLSYPSNAVFFLLWRGRGAAPRHTACRILVS